jgi:hypothetical protein
MLPKREQIHHAECVSSLGVGRNEEMLTVQVLNLHFSDQIPKSGVQPVVGE